MRKRTKTKTTKSAAQLELPFMRGALADAKTITKVVKMVKRSGGVRRTEVALLLKGKLPKDRRQKRARRLMTGIRTRLKLPIKAQRDGTDTIYTLKRKRA